MHVTARSYLTSGIAALGVGAMALAPIQPLPNHVAAAPQHAVESMAVELAATVNPIQLWIDTIQTSIGNIKTIIGQQLEPGPALPILNAVVSNLGVYLSELPDIGTILQQVLGNVKAAVMAPLDQNLTDPTPFGPQISKNTNNTDFVTCLGVPNCGDAGLTRWETTTFLAFDATGAYIPLVEFTNKLSSPLTGALLGFAGPGLSAIAQVMDSVNVISTALKAKNWAAVINEVINLPANLVNAGLNGGKHLDLTPIVNKLAPRLGITLPPGTEMGIATGGLLTPGVAMGSAPDSSIPPAFSGWSGTAWDAVSVKTNVGGLDAFIDGQPLGTVATQLGMRTTIANAIRLPKPTSAQSVAPAAAEIAEAPAAGDVPADTPAPSRATQRKASDNGGSGNTGRARGASKRGAAS